MFTSLLGWIYKKIVLIKRTFKILRYARKLKYVFYKICYIEIGNWKFLLPIFTSNLPFEIEDAEIIDKTDIGFLMISRLPNEFKKTSCSCALLATPGFTKLRPRMQIMLIILEMSHFILNHVEQCIKTPANKRLKEMEACLLESDEMPIRCGFREELKERLEIETDLYFKNVGRMSPYHRRRTFNLNQQWDRHPPQGDIEFSYFFFDTIDEVPDELLFSDLLSKGFTVEKLRDFKSKSIDVI